MNDRFRWDAYTSHGLVFIGCYTNMDREKEDKWCMSQRVMGERDV